jgi:hypothetical protein
MRVDLGVLTRDGRERIALAYADDTGACMGVIMTPVDPMEIARRLAAGYAACVQRFGPWLGPLIARALS